MKMLSNEQIKVYLKYSNGKYKKKKKKAYSRFKKDLKKFGYIRLNMCKEMYQELFEER